MVGRTNASLAELVVDSVGRANPTFTLNFKGVDGTVNLANAVELYITEFANAFSLIELLVEQTAVTVSLIVHELVRFANRGHTIAPHEDHLRRTYTLIRFCGRVEGVGRTNVTVVIGRVASRD